MAALISAVPPTPTFRQRGFTLTEMAMVLVIVALLLGGMILPMSAQQDIRYTTESQRLLADVSEALYGYAASHAAADGKPYLPCPDTDGNGVENRTGNSCTPPAPGVEGTLPWADLGLGRQDAWGNPLRYRVAAAYADNATGFTLLPAAGNNLRVCDSSACTTVLATALPAVVLSLGKNGAGTPTNADEVENTNGDDNFVQHTQTGSGSTGFDDLVVWLPASILTNRMISAGRLP